MIEQTGCHNHSRGRIMPRVRAERLVQDRSALQWTSTSAPAVLIYRVALLIVLVAFTAGSTNGQLLDRQPFDQITLSGADSSVVEVLPLDLPQRPLTTKPTEGVLRVRLLEQPTEEFEVDWNDIADVRFYEHMLLQEAKRLSAAGEFDAAYDYFARLLRDYPSLSGLERELNDYLRRNALALYQSQQYDRSLAVLQALYERDTSAPGLPQALDAVAGQIIEQHLRQQNFAAAIGVLDLWQNRFTGIESAAAAAWRQRFETAARRQLADAARFLQEKQFIAARKAAGRALTIWPELDEADEILARIQREYSFLTVGVFESSPREPMRRIDNWAARRTGRIVERLLVEQIGFGAEGGIYHSPYGVLELDGSGLKLSLRLNSSEEQPSRAGANAADGASSVTGITADELARFLLRMADPNDPEYRSQFASVLSGVSIAEGSIVEIHWNRPHVRPESLLQVPLPRGSDDSNVPRFKISDAEPAQTVFESIQPPGGIQRAGMQAIVEQKLADDEAAIAALLAGEIDILDRVPPWQVERLRTVANVRVQAYQLPTVHVLIPNYNRPLLAKREFRRAICYAVQREWIVQKLILGGTTMSGFEVVSGPFPAGVSLSDPLRYAYNNQLTPRPSEPRLAAVLASVASASLSEPEDGGEPARTDIPALTLAHPNDPLARMACQSIELQLSRAGIPIQLVEFEADELAAGSVDYDFRYAELAIWEPVVDGFLVLGAGGLAGDLAGPFMNAALRSLDEASNWKDVRTRLAEIHVTAHHDLPVIPLWQTVNYFAYRSNVRGIGDAPLTLYQNIEQWTTVSDTGLARTNSEN